VSDAYPQVEVPSREALRRWLEANHESSAGIWLVTYKKGDPRYLPYNDVVEEALCFGWIDSKARGLDERRTQLTLTPRRPGSNWSDPNKERVERLLALGLMAPAGLAAIERAKEDGTWAGESRPRAAESK
jgi:uncharacterized protein YdeI (YjbR/CyaY-like superfamily)